MSQEIRKKISYHQTELRRLRKQLRQSKGLGPKRKGLGCRDRDDKLKAERGYLELGSFVRRDGSEKLVGNDWLQRKLELAYRSGGFCEQLANFDGVIIRCQEEGRDPHHIIKRSKGRDDRLSNLLHLCGPHHDALDPRKPKWSFAVKPAPESEQQV